MAGMKSASATKKAISQVGLMETLMPLTTDSPLLLAGTVQARNRLAGKSEKGPWEMLFVEVRGCEGRVVSCQVNDPKSVPAVGEFVVLPCYLTTAGKLRQARNLMESF
jgi:hypothetical protein